MQLLQSAAALTAAEARMRLAPEPPALLAFLEDAAAEALTARLRAAGLFVVCVAARVPDDAQRTVARSFELSVEGALFKPRFGAPLSLPWSEVALILRAQRARRAETERTSKSSRLSVGTALATGGLKLTRTTSKTVRSVEESAGQLILVYGRDGKAATLAEGALEFTGLGDFGPSSTANMAELARRLRAQAPGAVYDERLLRLGRRPLPFGVAGEARVKSPGGSTVHVDTSASVDVLAEVLWRAHLAGLLP